MAVKAPEPTAPGHCWRCCSCTWRGLTLGDAKAHLLGTQADPDVPLAHHPFEEAVDATDVMSKTARRIMLPSGKPDTVMVSTYSAARRRLYATLDPLVADLRARGGRLRGKAVA